MVDERPAGLDSQRSSPVTPTSSFHDTDTEHSSDNESLATTVPETVMAEQVSKHAVNEAQSEGRPAPADDSTSTTTTTPAAAAG